MKPFILPSSTKMGTALSLPAFKRGQGERVSEQGERERGEGEVHPILSYDSATLVVLQRKAEAGSERGCLTNLESCVAKRLSRYQPCHPNLGTKEESANTHSLCDTKVGLLKN